jgi:DNA-binding HxlR family transcriptional regulator
MIGPTKSGAGRPGTDLDPEPGQKMYKAMGERWAMLLMREVTFGTHRFGELHRALGIAPNVLTKRLNSLVDAGMLERHQYREDKPWFEYHLTEIASELVPAWVMIARLADTRRSGSPRELVHTRCGEPTNPVLTCSACHDPIAGDELAYAERGARTGPPQR